MLQNYNSNYVKILSFLILFTQAFDSKLKLKFSMVKLFKWILPEDKMTNLSTNNKNLISFILK